eukprot:6567412-Ditylum_brightwellii.AAC.1
MTTTKLVYSLKVGLQHWKPLFIKIWCGPEEENCYLSWTVDRRGGSDGGDGGGSEDEDDEKGGGGDVMDVDMPE